MCTCNPAASPQKLFRLNAKYQIDPSATPGEMLNDASCFLDSARGVVMSITDQAGTEKHVDGSLYAVSYLLEMVGGLIHAAQQQTRHI